MLQSMIRIVVTGTRGFPNVQGGIENHCERLYTNIVTKGCDVTVITRKPYSDPDIHEYRGITLLAVDCPRNKYLEAIAHTFKSVIKARTLNPDILHIHAIGPSLFAPLARMLRMKVVITNHGHDYNRKKWSFPAKMFLKFCERMGVTFANEVISISSSIADELIRKYNRESTVIPNGVQPANFTDSDSILEKYNLQKNGYILAVGRLVPEKGFDDLIDAFKSCQKEHWKLVIVGDADHEDKYSRSLKLKAAKNSNIILTGYLSGIYLHEIYSHAGLFVLPSYHEGLPIVLLEAMSYGLSCIASDIPANRNVKLEDSRYFKTGDVKSLASKLDIYMERALSEVEKRSEINMISERYSWRKIAAQTLNVYNKILS